MSVVHGALLYSGTTELVKAGESYLREGLAAGDRCLAMAPTAKLAALHDALGTDASFVDLVDSRERYARLGPLFSGFADYLSEHGRAGRGRVRVLAEPQLSTSAEWRCYQRYDSALNLANRHHCGEVICCYDRADLPDEVLDNARRTHPNVSEGPVVSLRASAHYVEPSAYIRDHVRSPLSPPGGDPLPLEGPHGLTELRQALADRAVHDGLGVDQVHAIVVAVNEIATNAIMHGGPPIGVRCWRENESLVCQVDDAGPGLAEPVMSYLPPDATSLGGRGLWLAHQLADLVELRTSGAGTSVRLRFATSPGAGAGRRAGRGAVRRGRT